MGQQSLKIKNRVEVLNQIQKELLEDADKKYMKDHFLVGEDINMDKVKHNQLIEYALCTPNCEIIDWVWYKINKDFSKEEYCKLIFQEIDIKMYNTTECTE